MIRFFMPSTTILLQDPAFSPWFVKIKHRSRAASSPKLKRTAKGGTQYYSQPLPRVVLPEAYMMSSRWYYESGPSGKPQYIPIKRSHSHGHHHHHHHHHRRWRLHPDHDVIEVDREEWNRLIERKGSLEDANKSLLADIAALKASLSTAQAEAHHLCHIVVPQLQGQVNALVADNEALRQTIEKSTDGSAKHCRELERLRKMMEELEREKCHLAKENEELRDKIKCLTRQLEAGCGRRLSDLLRDVEYWKDRCRFWKRKYEDTRQRHDDICGLLEIRTQKMRAYEEILRRRGII
ncbi:hypothetical protein DCS_02367 [Drechmeria coniospora]|uniref:Uncharacterized protein n=1 Tax=Drechmeria coniospora TaxID=98403 RepID=A0A151GVU6_DRECN|nr:hypothetical protein DCS_02367 [Drechmeria coniospora]KYK61226.1 hypothetical protein DCS_02367 [Drechmeria coniospora]